MRSMKCLPLPPWALEASFPSSDSLVILITALAGVGDGSGEDSGDEGERPGKEDDEDEDEEDAGAVDSPVRFVISAIVFTSCLTDR